jgi:hypothetical protein
MWDPKRDSRQDKKGVQLHLAKMAAFRAAGRHTEVRELITFPTGTGSTATVGTSVFAASIPSIAGIDGMLSVC